jgi:hypothetical protein
MALSGFNKDNMINKNKEVEIERLKIIGEQTIAIDAFKKTFEIGRRKSYRW